MRYIHVPIISIMQMLTDKYISKEKIAVMTFRNSDVLRRESDRIIRHLDVKRAKLIGNRFNKMVEIIFECKQGTSVVFAKVCGIDGEFLELNGRIFLPLSSVKRVLFLNDRFNL